jgi:hypothetical protein
MAQMAMEDRELIKHDVTGESVPVHPVEHPPFAKAPDMAETLRLLERISRMPDIRFEKVNAMRELIAKGQLETPQRIDGTVRRLMEDLGL